MSTQLGNASFELLGRQFVVDRIRIDQRATPLLSGQTVSTTVEFVAKGRLTVDGRVIAAEVLGLGRDHGEARDDLISNAGKLARSQAPPHA